MTHTHQCSCGKQFTPRLAVLWVTATGTYSDADCPDCGNECTAFTESVPVEQISQGVA